MEVVVLHSDIARLVLGYLKKQRLESASRVFCKSSPHLQQEFSAYKKGLLAHSFYPELEEIICEYVKITRKVEQLMAVLPEALRARLFPLKLSDKVIDLLERVVQTPDGAAVVTANSAQCKNNDKTNSSAGNTSIQSDKENTAKRHNIRKRKRSSLAYSSDERRRSVMAAGTKRRRVLETFCYLSLKQQNLTSKADATNSSSTGNDETDEHELDSDEENVNNDEDEAVDDIERDELQEDIELSMMEEPTQESTPRTRLVETPLVPPTLPEISQAILDNPEFQMKLVDNINQALLSSSHKDNTNSTTATCGTAAFDAHKDRAPADMGTKEVQPIISSNQLLDEMVKTILEATEKDPTFDAIIEEVVGASNKSLVSAGVQCNIDIPPAAVPPTSATLQSALMLPSASLAQPQQNVPRGPYNALSGTEGLSTLPMAPHTPLIIRNVVDAATVPNNEPAANSSFGSLIDPNFSLSKLIVLNANESVQKQSLDQSLGNTTADQLLNQLGGAVEAGADDQVYFDPNTGQLTIPLFLTDEGLLTNLPFLINNEVITQQLQSDNLTNLDAARIEIPLPEPIIFSADQLPPNSIIVGSAQKTNTEDVQQQQQQQLVHQRTVCKANKNCAKDLAAPSSLDSRLPAERATPLTSGIANAKLAKSLSTPRKRTSHVRTLSFSPQTSGSCTTLAGATPQSTRRDMPRRTLDVPKTIAEEEAGAKLTLLVEKPIIKNVEILPCITTIDTSANESSNSCSVPPLFAGEESSNQTVIKTDLCVKEPRTQPPSVAASTSVSVLSANTDTPKRRQLRPAAVRACKRQLSKSSNDDEQAVDKEKAEVKVENKDKAVLADASKLEKDEMMEEWRRMRSATTNDLDSRMRELNAQMRLVHSVRREVRKKPLRRKKAASAKQKQIKKSKGATKLEIVVLDDGKESTAQPSKSKKPFQEKRRVCKEKQREFNIKIPTPQKVDKSKEKTAKKPKPDAARTVSIATSKETDAKSSPDATTNGDHPVSAKPVPANYECEKRTGNIACLLDTPFKETSAAGIVPPTPGIFAPSLDTPLSKLRPSDEVQHSASFLFGSLTKSELETPLLSAITPGLRFTPFGSSRDVTPRSVAPATDYSSGGSYYKPDESDDLDRNIDKMLRDTTQKRLQSEQSCAPVVDSEIEVVNARPNAMDAGSSEMAICVEIPAEKLKVEPIVLKRVKSFGGEANNSTQKTASMTTTIDPHYTLASELPEICTVDEESSNSSNTLSGSSSSSSSTSNSSSSSDSDSSSAANGAATAQRANSLGELNTPQKSRVSLSLENLSDISSTEDEEWQKLALTEEEDSRLVSNDGEVRYPVRSWLTPNKTQSALATQPATTIKVTLPLKSAEKHGRYDEELRLKRERIKEKLKLDQRKDKHPPAVASPSTGGSVQKLQSLREKPKLGRKLVSSPIADDLRTIDVLTALNLSAKKQSPAATAALEQTSVAGADEAKTLAPPPSDIDDNAVSNLFAGASTPELKSKAEAVPLKTLIKAAKGVPKKCLPIAALPLTRAVDKRRKVVGKAASSKAATPRRAASTRIVASAAKKVLLPKIKISPPLRTSKPRVSPRLKQEAKDKADVIKSKPGAEKSVSKTRSKPAVETAEVKKTRSLVRNCRSTKNARREVIPKAKNAEEIEQTEEVLPQKSTVEANIKPQSKPKSKLKSDALVGKATKDECVVNVGDIKTKAEDVVLTTTPTPLTTSVDRASIACPAKAHVAQVDSSEDDTLEGCELTSITAADPRCFISLTYQGPDGPPEVPPPHHDLSKFRVVVAFDEDDQHIWQVTDEILLFSSAPTTPPCEQPARTAHPIRNIPKKRKIRVSTMSTSDDKETVQTPDASSATAEHTASTFAATITSTPVAAKATTIATTMTTTTTTTKIDAVAVATAAAYEKETKENTVNMDATLNTAEEATIAKPVTDSAAAPRTVASTQDAAEKIQIEDIESILSHLHGT